MIKYNYEVSVNENRAKLNKDIFLFRGNRNIHYYFSIKGARFAFEKEGDLIENANAIYAAVTVIKPNGVEVANAIAPVENGLIHLKVTEDLIDEEVEIGDFDLVFDLFDDSDGAVTIPKIKGQFHVQERPCTTSIGTLSGNVNVVNQAVVDLAIATQENEQLIVVDDDGKYVKTTWVKGDKISIERLNKIEEGIEKNSTQYKDIANKTVVENNKLYLVKADGTKLDEGTELPTSGNVSNVFSPLKTVNIGEIFEQPETYLAWFQGCMKYDEEIQCPVAVISGKDTHLSGSGKCYFLKIEPNTGEITLSVAGQYDDEDTYGCFSQSFYIDKDGNYNFYASIHESSGWTEINKRKYTSIDKGKTWTFKDVTKDKTPNGSIIKLKTGRLIGLIANGNSARGQAIYSDDNGETWTEGFVFSGSTEVEIIELKDCLIAIGRKNLTYTNALPAILYFSSDNGINWTDGIESTTITDMCNPCSGIYWNKDNVLELFYCSRASNNGNTGTIYHAYAKLEDAKNDNFTVEKIGDSKQTSIGIDFGYCSTACNQDEKAWVIYYDKADSGKGVNLNLILCDKIRVTLPVSNSTNSLISLYSSKTIEDKIKALKITLNNRINEIIISGGGSVTPPSGGGDVTEGFYTLDKLKLCIDAKTLTNYSKTGIKELISQTEATITPNIEGTAITDLISSKGLSKSTLVFNLPTALNPDNGITIELTLNGSDIGTLLEILPENPTGSWANSFGRNSTNGNQITDSYDYVNTSNERIGNNCRGSRNLGDWSNFTHFVLIIPSLESISKSGVKGRFICNNIELDNTANWWGYENFKSFLPDLVKKITFKTGSSNLDNTLISLRVYSKELSLDEINANYKYEQSRQLI